jgi:hypothetical protein
VLQCGKSGIIIKIVKEVGKVRQYKIVFFRGRELHEQIVKADFYKEAVKILKGKFGEKIDVYGWVRV